MRIAKPIISYLDNQVKLSAQIEYLGEIKEIWYSLDKRYEDFLTVTNSDPFIIGGLLLAMRINEDIFIQGNISEQIYYNLTNYFIKIITLLIPSLKKISIFPNNLVSDTAYKSSGVATGFSGGIDSFCAFIDHYHTNISKSYQLTHLVLNNVGSHGQGGRDLFNKRYNRLSNFAKEYDLPLIKIDSNLDDILSMEFRNTHTTRNISAILTLQKLFGKYLYASAHEYKNCFIGESPDGAVIDPFGIHLLSTESTEMISTGCQYSRIQKTIKVSEFEPSYRYLDVCVHAVDEAKNCSTCWKCVRTLVTLEILNKQNLYHQVFNLQAFSQVREQSIQALKQSNSPLDKEVIELAKKTNYEI